MTNEITDRDFQAVVETDLGEFRLEFYPDVAPKHVQRFRELAEEGIYDGVTFHRVIPGFMIQGGDPNTKKPDYPKQMHGTGSSEKPDLAAEFNEKPHLRGTLSAARSQNPNSANSQFFICVDRIPHLDGQYSVYGGVVEGIEVVDKIVSVKRDSNDNPLKPVRIKSIRFVAPA